VGAGAVLGVVAVAGLISLLGRGSRVDADAATIRVAATASSLHDAQVHLDDWFARLA